MPSHSQKAATYRRTPQSKIVGHGQAVGLEAFHRRHKCRRGVARKPRRRTPFVVLGQRRHAMQRRVVMHIMQPRQVRFFKCDPAVPELKPHFPPRRVVPQIDLLGSLHVKFAEEFSQSTGIGRRDSHEMIMIGQHRPSAQFPAEFVGVGEQGFEKEIQAFGRVQMRELLMGAAGDHVKASLKQPMGWRVRPVRKLTSPFGVRGHVRAWV